MWRCVIHHRLCPTVAFFPKFRSARRFDVKRKIDSTGHSGLPPEHGENPARQTASGSELDRNAKRVVHQPPIPTIAEMDDELVAGGALGGESGNRRIIGWMASVIVHLLVVILLAWLSISFSGTERGFSIQAELGQNDGNEVDLSVNLLQPEQQEDQRNDVSELTPVKIPEVTARSVIASLDSPVKQTVDRELEALKAMLASGSVSSNAMVPMRSASGGGYSARTPEGRTAQGDQFGATPESEAAVEAALQWLAAHQRSDGSWSFDLRQDPCSGRCRHGRPIGAETPTPSTAATGLALLCFLGAGYNDLKGPYQQNVQKGLYYLRQIGRESDFGIDLQRGSMYGHGIAMLALTEAMVMSRQDGQVDPAMMQFVNRGVQFTSAAQHEGGSWGYIPGVKGDTTITGWQVMSMVGAKKLEFSLPTTLFRRVVDFLMTVREQPGYHFGYRTPEAQKTTTAVALTILTFLGHGPGQTLFDRAVYEIAEAGPTQKNIYHDYYATLLIFHTRNELWPQWNQQMRDYLVKTQAKRGHEAGSWHFPGDRYGDVGGRLYTTCMATLTLEVYYRYLPLYDEVPEFPL